MAWIVFIVLSVLCVGSVAAMILSRNAAHNALFLVLAFAALGGLFGLLDAPFAAAVQVLVYAGAIMVLFLFALMMFDLRRPAQPDKPGFRLALTLVLALVLLGEIALALARLVRGGGGPGGAPGHDVWRLGALLFTDYLYAFEITSLLILAALAGGLTLAKRKDTP